MAISSSASSIRVSRSYSITCLQLARRYVLAICAGIHARAPRHRPRPEVDSPCHRRPATALIDPAAQIGVQLLQLLLQPIHVRLTRPARTLQQLIGLRIGEVRIKVPAAAAASSRCVSAAPCGVAGKPPPRNPLRFERQPGIHPAQPEHQFGTRQRHARRCKLATQLARVHAQCNAAPNVHRIGQDTRGPPRRNPCPLASRHARCDSDARRLDQASTVRRIERTATIQHPAAERPVEHFDSQTFRPSGQAFAANATPACPTRDGDRPQVKAFIGPIEPHMLLVLTGLAVQALEQPAWPRSASGGRLKIYAVTVEHLFHGAFGQTGVLALKQPDPFIVPTAAAPHNGWLNSSALALGSASSFEFLIDLETADGIGQQRRRRHVRHASGAACRRRPR